MLDQWAVNENRFYHNDQDRTQKDKSGTLTFVAEATDGFDLLVLRGRSKKIMKCNSFELYV